MAWPCFIQALAKYFLRLRLIWRLARTQSTLHKGEWWTHASVSGAGTAITAAHGLLRLCRATRPPAVSRRTPVSCSIRLSDQPNCPSAITSLKTLPLPTEATCTPAGASALGL